MNTLQNRLTRKLLLAAASVLFISPMAYSQDKSASSQQAPGGAPGQASNQAAGAAVQGGASGGAGASGSSGASNGGNQPAKSQGKQAGNAKSMTTFLLIPINTPEQNQWMKKGCWAKFYDDQNFSGDNLTLMGPVDMPDMTGPFGIDWKGKISSVETGPKARVLVYDNENFKDLVSTFKPGQKSSDVSKKMGFFDEFSSMRVTCDNLKANSSGKS
ncbi:MAG: beta/gamma crystallin domain-containing protein [Burkholderiaceae bacterium]